MMELPIEEGRLGYPRAPNGRWAAREAVSAQRYHHGLCCAPLLASGQASRQTTCRGVDSPPNVGDAYGLTLGRD